MSGTAPCSDIRSEPVPTGRRGGEDAAASFLTSGLLSVAANLESFGVSSHFSEGGNSLQKVNELTRFLALMKLEF